MYVCGIRELSQEAAMKKRCQTTEKHMQKLTMKQLPKEDRPYEKCLESGAASLTDAELLAVIIRTGSREGNTS